MVKLRAYCMCPINSFPSSSETLLAPIHLSLLMNDLPEEILSWRSGKTPQPVEPSLSLRWGRRGGWCEVRVTNIRVYQCQALYLAYLFGEKAGSPRKFTKATIQWEWVLPSSRPEVLTRWEGWGSLQVRGTYLILLYLGYLANSFTKPHRKTTGPA